MSASINSSSNDNPRQRTVLARGSTSTIYKSHDDHHRVVKVLHGPHAAKLFSLEKRVLQRLHTSLPSASASAASVALLDYFGVETSFPHALILECAVQGSFYDLLFTFEHPSPRPADAVYRRWARQAATALVYAHRNGIWHGDIHVVNFLADENRDLRVADWGAAVIDGEDAAVCRYRRTHQLWTPSPDCNLTTADDCHDDADKTKGKSREMVWRRECSVASELFALGCALFHLETGHDAFDDLQDDADEPELLRRLRAREMPCTKSLTALGDVIRKCWELEYTCMDDVLADLAATDNDHNHVLRHRF